jgi:hypothetical protein
MPWLESLAANFEQYDLMGMLFEYKSLYSDASTTPYLGAVIMATEYNSAKPAFADKLAMENSEFASSAKPSVSMFHPIECALKETPTRVKYIRTGPVPPGSAINLYDVGIFQIATEGQPAAGAGGVIGELWCTYNIRLLKPILTKSITGASSDFFTSASGSNGVLNGIAASSGNNIGIKGKSVVNAANNFQETFTFPAVLESGYYQMNVMYYGAAATILYPTFTTANVDIVPVFSTAAIRDASSFYSPVNGVSSASVTFSRCFKLLPGSAESVISFNTGSSSVGPCVLPTNSYVTIEFVQIYPPSTVAISAESQLSSIILDKVNEQSDIIRKQGILIEQLINRYKYDTPVSFEPDSPIELKSNNNTPPNSPNLSSSTVLAGRTYLQSLLNSKKV